MRNHAIFLDRDGTINEEVHHLSHVDQLQLLPSVGEAIKQLNAASFKVVVITNQSVVARGIISQEELGDIHKTMKKQLKSQGAHVDAVYFCPHHPTAGVGAFGITCDCRKPQPGMLLQASADLNITLENSFMIGDTYNDLAAGHAAGCRTILVRTGYGTKTERQLDGRSFQPDYIASDLLEAAQWIIHLEG